MYDLSGNAVADGEIFREIFVNLSSVIIHPDGWGSATVYRTYYLSCPLFL
jgi:hypothetical protein